MTFWSATFQSDILSLCRHSWRLACAWGLRSCRGWNPAGCGSRRWRMTGWHIWRPVVRCLAYLSCPIPPTPARIRTRCFRLVVFLVTWQPLLEEESSKDPARFINSPGILFSCIHCQPHCIHFRSLSICLRVKSPFINEPGYPGVRTLWPGVLRRCAWIFCANFRLIV